MTATAEPQITARPTYLVAKRLLDIGLGTVLLILTLPVMVVAALAVLVDSGRPIIFRQRRVGLGGREFTMFKFRTMLPENDESIHRRYMQDLLTGRARPRRNGRGEVVYLLDDPRVTKVGRVLRTLSIDELPNLVNVIRGDMSLVGPRPPIPYEVAMYDQRSRRRLSVKPGMTGLAQVKGRGSLTFDEIVDLDLEYVRRRSLWLDVKILLATIPAVIGRRGV